MLSLIKAPQVSDYKVCGASTPGRGGCRPLCLTWDTGTMVCPGYCEVALGSDFKVTVLSEFVMEEGELVAEVVDPGRQEVQNDEVKSVQICS